MSNGNSGEVLSSSHPVPKYANIPTREELFAKNSHKNWYVFALNIQAPNNSASTFKSKILEIQLIVRDIALLVSMSSSHLQ